MTDRRANNRWILISGIILIFAYGLFFLLNKDLYESNFTSREAQLSEANFWQSAFVGILIAPLLEEFLFRGNFFRNNILKWLSVTSFVIFIIFFSNLEISVIVTSSLYLVTLFTKLKFKSNILFVFKVILSSLIFGLTHYSDQDFLHVEGYLSLCWHMGIGFIFVFLMVRYNILVSWLTHLFFNMSVFILLFLGLNNMDRRAKKINLDSHVQMEYRFLPLNQDGTYFRSSSDTIEYFNGSPLKLQQLISSGTSDSIPCLDLVNSIPFAKYHFVITSDSLDLEHDEWYIDNMLTDELLKCVELK